MVNINMPNWLKISAFVSIIIYTLFFIFVILELISTSLIPNEIGKYVGGFFFFFSPIYFMLIAHYTYLRYKSETVGWKNFFATQFIVFILYLIPTIFYVIGQGNNLSTSYWTFYMVVLFIVSIIPNGVITNILLFYGPKRKIKLKKYYIQIFKIIKWILIIGYILPGIILSIILYFTAISSVMPPNTKIPVIVAVLIGYILSGVILFVFYKYILIRLKNRLQK